ncbi:MAG: hypothetical protein U9Q81_04290 [Pseudomonadota bacterium]|nr:hypothetical protein [Pseudomonadota bacterium]
MVRLLLCLLLLSPVAKTWAATVEDRVPESLKPWIPWVLDREDRRDCPLHGGAGERLCAWPGRLHLDLDRTGGLFAQRWQLYAEGWVPLPGDKAHWPQDVRVGSDFAAVVEHEGVPALKLDAGEYAVSGRFVWRERPEGLAVPTATGLVALSLDGEPVQFPRRDRDGRLWLGRAEQGTAGAERDVLALEVYRRVEDDIPLRVLTRLELDVAGEAREVALGPVLLDGGIPLGVDSPLPARLEPDGLLRLQVRPGRWTVAISERHPEPVTALDLGERAAPWPGQEVWVFAAHPDLRQVEVTGADPVDPRQTRLPPEWAPLPAYLMKQGGELRLVQIRRGDTDPGPDRLSLSRDLWLDFGGDGYTLRDRIDGELVRSWRLEVGDTLDLGQVLVGGEPRFITRLADSAREGVEVRQGLLDLVADSRIAGDVRRLPASGWELDFQSVQARLHLPPGWDLLAVSGVDNLPDSWLNRWTLLDLFLVLIIALAVARLWSWGWGALALLTIVLIWQEPEAPRTIWLQVLAAYALLRLLPKDPARTAMARLRRFLLFYYRASLVVLAVIALPFLVDQVRNGIYPQLERSLPPMSAVPVKDVTRAPAPAEAPVPDSFEMRSDIRHKARTPLAGTLATAPKPVPVVDPDARVQTGPGVPTWRRTSIDLAWSGPVPRDQVIGLWLLTPGWNLVLALARLALVVLLALKLAGLFGTVLRRRPAVALVLLAAGLAGMPTPAPAQDFPSPELLEALKTRLLEPPDCLPACADISRMDLTTTDEELRLLLRVDVRQAAAVPVPGSAGIWTPTRIHVDGEPLDELRRGADGTYLVALPAGRTSLELSGPLPPRAQVEIPLPLRPHRVQVAGDGWRVEGIDENGYPGAQIRLVRLRRAAEDEGELQPAEVPPLLRIQRTLHLGVDWSVATRVIRLSPPEPPIVLEVPLLPGEQVLRENARVRDGRLLVNLAPGQRMTDWASKLEPVDSITLRAAEDDRLSEEWRVDVSPLWHLETAGIPVIHHLGRLTRWLPTWRPWPGEEVRLSLSRPAGVPGPTLTLDESAYRLTPGPRATEAALDLTLRSSQGGEHGIRLPEGAELRRVTLDGAERPLRLEDRTLTLPLAPATQRWHMEWRQPDALGGFYSPPVPDLAISGVNASVGVELGRDRWVLLTGGPMMGPAVLFWGLVVVLIVLAIGLGRSRLTPLKTRDWLLLGLGLSQAGVWVGLLVAGWLFALGLRGRLNEDVPPWRFNLAQTGLALLSLAALAALVSAIQQGLLGLPEMQIAGNGSSATSLNWYQDHTGRELPEVWVISVPILVYRGLMLAWALWLALRLLSWLRWGWQRFASPVLWREVKLKLPRRKGPARAGAASPADQAAGTDR